MKEKHRFNFFPEISAEDAKGLRESIAKGFDATLGKITLYEGKVLDGWNRYKACIDTGVEPVFTTFYGNDMEAFNFSVNANLDRRHLTSSQKGAMAVSAKPLLEAIQKANEEEGRRKQAEAQRRIEAEKRARKEREERERLEAIRREEARKAREAELKKQQALADKRRKKEIEAEKLRIEEERKQEEIARAKRLEEDQSVQLIAPTANREENKTRTKLADAFGTNRQYINDAKKIQETSPELFQEVLDGKKTIPEVKKELKKAELIEKKEVYSNKISKVSSNEFKVDIFNTDKKFRVIYADPAWSYNDKQDTPQLGGASKHYDTMTISQISELPVKEISEKDSVLFLWVTSPLLEDAFRVVNSWGFKYKTSFIWDKVKHNMGHYNSVRHEILLVCTKGSCTPDNKKLYDSVQSIERNDNHSEKPIEFLDIIDDLYEFGNKLEMFSRDIKKDKWFGWGNEI